ncbi:hypothetical protein ACFLWX_01355 [Chloroflexota bacterium]
MRTQITSGHYPRGRDKSLRQDLGIPDDAQHIIIFAESSHWDPGWMLTSEEYFYRYVSLNLDLAIAELIREPRRIYSVECVFFLRKYWEQKPEQREKIVRLANEGRLRLTGSGVTTPDTLLPNVEAIMRDFLIGQEWLRTNGISQEPRIAYFPDSFGHSPALPSILTASGFELAAITRIDGMFFMGADYEPRGRFPRAKSSAETLMNREHSLDFIWRGPDGAEVLCHWNAYTYGQGDMLAYRGLIRIGFLPLVLPDRSECNISHKISRYTRELIPYSRTPYLFCPIGMDFVSPIPDLIALLDRYNSNSYHNTGIWAVNAGLDDYLALVDCHRGALPSLELDPNPYWTGFYTSRPTLKKRCHELVDMLLMAEKLALVPEAPYAGDKSAAEIQELWWDVALSNHHDFITGTSRDRVVEKEQRPILEQAIDKTRTTVARMARDIGRETFQRSSTQSQKPEWRSQGGKIEVRTPYYNIKLDEAAGGGIISAYDPTTNHSLLLAVSNDLVSNVESGGLWRMGHEFWGGKFKEHSRASHKPGRLEVIEHENGLEIVCLSQLDGENIRRLLWFDGDSPLIRSRIEGYAAERRTVTVSFAINQSADHLAMDAAGGVVVRPPSKQYDPTFWPVQHFIHLQDSITGTGIALFLKIPGAISYKKDCSLEVIALRNAIRERVFGLIPLGFPLGGHERDSYTFEYGFLFTRTGDWHYNSLPSIAHSLSDSPWDPSECAELRRLVDSIATTDHPHIRVIAVKPSSRGQGLLVRLATYSGAGSLVTVRLHKRTVLQAFLCDARERDIKPLQVQAGSVHFTMPGNLATLRLLT